MAVAQIEIQFEMISAGILLETNSSLMTSFFCRVPLLGLFLCCCQLPLDSSCLATSFLSSPFSFRLFSSSFLFLPLLSSFFFSSLCLKSPSFSFALFVPASCRHVLSLSSLLSSSRTSSSSSSSLPHLQTPYLLVKLPPLPVFSRNDHCAASPQKCHLFRWAATTTSSPLRLHFTSFSSPSPPPPFPANEKTTSPPPPLPPTTTKSKTSTGFPSPFIVFLSSLSPPPSSAFFFLLLFFDSSLVCSRSLPRVEEVSPAVTWKRREEEGEGIPGELLGGVEGGLWLCSETRSPICGAMCLEAPSTQRLTFSLSSQGPKRLTACRAIRPMSHCDVSFFFLFGF